MPTNNNEIIGSNIATNVSVPNGSYTITIGSNDTSITIGNGNDTITAGDHDKIAIGNGNKSLTIGSYDNITLGDGNTNTDGGNNDTIVAGNGVDTVTVGANSKITAGNGNDNLTAGPNSIISAGNGVSNVHAGANSQITLGSGPDTVSAGTTDTITVNPGSSLDTIKYDGLTPEFTVPASISVDEEHSVALPISLLPPNFGSEVINGFKTVNGIILFDTQDFANYAAVQANMAQVGANVVITQPGGSGAVTLDNTKLSSLSAKNFGFFTGTTDTITISGVPADATLNHGTQTGPGTWSLMPSDLTGLTLNAGEPIGYPAPDQITVTIANPSGQQASSSQMFPLVVNAIPPTVGVSALPYENGDPVTETRLSITSATDDGDSGKDYINRLQFSGVPTGTTLSSPDGTVTNNGGGVWTLSTTGNPASFNPEVDVTTPAAQTTNFTLGVTAYSDEPNSPELSKSTSQNIDVQYSTATQNPDFTSSGQNIWTSGGAFSTSFDKFLGFTFGPTKGSTGFSFGTLGLTVSQHFGASASLKSGFQSDLNVNGGSFSGQLPFQVNAANTYNEINKALEVDPTDSQSGGGSFTTTGPSGSYELDFVLDIYARVFTHGSFGSNSATLIDFKTTVPLLSKNSATMNGSFKLPDGIGTVAFAWPQVNTTGSNPNPGTISSQGTSAPIFSVNLDPIAIVLDAIVGSDPLKGSLLGGVVNYTILAATLNPAADLKQMFNLNATLPGGTITPDGGSGESFNFGSPVIIPNSDGEFSLTLDPNTTLENDTSLAGQLTVGVRALKGTINLSISGIGTNIGFGPLINPKTTFGPGTLFNLYKNTFPVAFNPTTLPTVSAG